ncbi:hypothetical protein ACFLU6_02975 [Acidobacteriota bacterium]
MKSITIHGLDGPVVSLLESRAKAEGLSLNRTIKKLLEEALGARPKDVSKRREEFVQFLGLWSKSDLSSFQKGTEDFERVDKEDWK